MTVEPHSKTQTPALEWNVSPKGGVEVESVCNAAMRPPLKVTAQLCTKDRADPTWGVTKQNADGYRQRICPDGVPILAENSLLLLEECTWLFVVVQSKY